ncbi:hypothetical protein BGX38DRAFT_1243490 [Terfezia claveryi]|nr:hypothetical protein BGX38DRAFT_1243490 [Terfezia claveryi]
MNVYFLGPRMLRDRAGCMGRGGTLGRPGDMIRRCGGMGHVEVGMQMRKNGYNCSHHRLCCLFQKL